MALAELKNNRVSLDDIHRTFEMASYLFMIEQRCPFHLHLGICHCSVARCHAAAKLISDYLIQLYVPKKLTPTPINEKNSQNPFVNRAIQSSSHSTNNTPNQLQQTVGVRYDQYFRSIIYSFEIFSFLNEIN